MSRLAAEPDIKREVEYYRNNISNIKSIEDFLGNHRIYSFVMAAFGMKDLIYAKAMIRKVLAEGIDGSSSFALNLSDQRFREFAQVFNFKRFGKSTTTFERTQQGTIERFLRNTLEERAGQSSEAVRLALYFDRKAASLSTEYGILADKAIYAVVRAALGLPDSVTSANIDKQAKILADRVNVAEFADPRKRTAFVTRFLAMADATSGSNAASPSLALQAGASPRIDMNTLLSIQSLKRFGS